MDEAVKEYLAERQPSRQFIAPEAVGSLVVYLCGEQARDITGSVLPIDGGWLAS
jgi:3-hydroxybutyrate dehydrogenase